MFIFVLNFDLCISLIFFDFAYHFLGLIAGVLIVILIYQAVKNQFKKK